MPPQFVRIQSITPQSIHKIPMKTFLQATVVLLWSALVAGYCPDEQTIAPCRCKAIKDGISVECKGPESSERITNAIGSIRSSGSFDLVLESFTLPVLPPSVKNVSSLRLYDVHVDKLQDTSSITWSKLNDVVIESSSISEKPWPYLKGAKFLKHLKVSNMEVPVIGSEFNDGVPSGVAYLDIRKTQTVTVEAGALSHLVDLKYLLVVDVPLKQFPRDALPSEIPHLHTFILGNTQIEKLEAGFFEGMPKLEVLMLNGNKLTTLDFSLFSSMENHLTHLLAERNPLVCSCNLLWLTKNAQIKGSMKVLATCNDEVTQERKEVTSLDESEYCPQDK